MLGNFSYCNPTKLYFGDDSLRFLSEELHKYGPNVVLIYGGGSIKKNGIYKEVTKILQESGKNVEEIAGVMPNPTLAKLYEGIEITRSHHADLLLAVGGGSVCDYAKAVSVSVNCEEDPWEKYYLRFEEPACETLPVGCVLTMVGTGSEMNAGAVITNQETKQKIGHVFADERIMPKFAILNPRYTLTLPRYQMVSGIYDIFNHICEQYFSGEDDNVSDYISEGLMRAVLHASRIANRDPQDYEARSNLMWTATWALNTLVSRGKSTDWMVHMIGQSVGAYTNATKTDEQVAEEGLNAMEVWMRELGLVMKISELGATEDMLEGIADGTIILSGGYKALDHSAGMLGCTSGGIGPIQHSCFTP